MLTNDDSSPKIHWQHSLLIVHHNALRLRLLGSPNLHSLVSACAVRLMAAWRPQGHASSFAPPRYRLLLFRLFPSILLRPRHFVSILWYSASHGGRATCRLLSLHSSTFLSRSHPSVLQLRRKGTNYIVSPRVLKTSSTITTTQRVFFFPFFSCMRASRPGRILPISFFCVFLVE